MKPSFNLVTEPWIPCLAKNGKHEELSLKEMFISADTLRALENDDPLFMAAMHRLALAILHRAIKGPVSLEDWNNLWCEKNFTKYGIDEYLDKWIDSFDLFSETKPFYQTAGFRTSKSAKPGSAGKLRLSLASANNKTLFDHNTDETFAGFTAPEAARALLATQLFSLGGGKGVKSELFGEHGNLAEAPAVRGATVILEGANLFETLMLNLVTFDTYNMQNPNKEDDMPLWERDEPFEPCKRSPYGYLDYLTWPSRHIKLLPERLNRCVLVRKMYIGQACSLRKDIEAPDPMFARESDKKNGEKVYLKISKEKELWRDSASLFMFSAKDKNRPGILRQAAEAIGRGYIDGVHAMKCKIFGLANDQANPLLWRQEVLPVPQGILTDEELPRLLCRALERAEKTGCSLESAVNKFAELIIRDEGNADKKMVKNPAKSFGVMERYWASMEIPFFQFLNDLPSRKLEDWQKICSDNARKAFSRFSSAGPETSSRELKAYVKAWVQLQSGLKK